MSAKVTMITGTLLGEYEQEVQSNMIEHIEEIKKRLSDNAEFIEEFDEGVNEVYFGNYYDGCYMIAEDYLGKLIEAQHVDLSDDEYDMLNVWLGDWLANELAYFEQECISNYKEKRQ